MKHIARRRSSQHSQRMERKDRLQMKLSGPFLFLLCSFLILLLALVPVAPTENPALSWNLRVTVEKKKKTEILHHAFGQMKPGSLHAIIGSSGSGKVLKLLLMITQIQEADSSYNPHAIITNINVCTRLLY